MVIVILFFIAHWYLSLFAQTFFQHRYAAHGGFKMSKGWERFFFILCYITQGSSYMSPRAYAIMHRMHHSYTDTENDPHSPNFSSNLFTMMWRTRNFYQEIFKRKRIVEERFEKNLPEWESFDRFASSTVSRIMWAGLYVAFYVYFAPSAWWYLLLPVHFATGAFHGAIINWFAHKYGYINFKLKNTSQNLFRMDILMLGESYHNNHHKRPSSVNFGFKWHEIDPVYPVIRVLHKMRVIRINALPATEE
ncbi:MAG: fatty acid desaturase [Chitinophagaceae bacterium]|nr:fatty acid desaturase [Chitinophagaceae bacterium]